MSQPNTQPLTYNSVVDAKAYSSSEIIHDLYTTMRRDDPIVYLEPEGYRPFWAITRYDDVKSVELKWNHFTSGPRPILMSLEEERQSMEECGSAHPAPTLLTMDGDEHKKYRLVSQDFFMPKNVATLQPMVERIAKEYVDKMAAMGGECDFANDIAFYYPLKVVCELVGIPEEDEGRILLWAQRLFGVQDEQFGIDENGERVPQYETLKEQGAYFKALAEDRRKNPKNDFATVLANATIDGEFLEESRMIAYFSVLATAGHETTSGVVAGGLRALAENPDQLAKLKENPELLNSAVDEMIRWVAPLKHFLRTTQESTEIGGKMIQKGDLVALFYASASRDESAFENADKFDIERKPNKHLAFGFGPHVCLGQHLAKLELIAFFKELLPRLEKIELTDEPKMMQSTLTSGLKYMPVKYTLS